MSSGRKRTDRTYLADRPPIEAGGLQNHHAPGSRESCFVRHGFAHGIRPLGATGRERASACELALNTFTRKTGIQAVPGGKLSGIRAQENNADDPECVIVPPPGSGAAGRPRSRVQVG